MTGWSMLPVVAVSNLVPLWLVVTGRMATADLLMAYVVDMWVAMLLAALHRRQMWAKVRAHISSLKDFLGAVFGLLIVLGVVGGLSFEVITAVTWDKASVLSITSVCACQAVGLWSNREVDWGGLSWRFLLLAIGAGFGLATAQGYARLSEHGWQPAELGGGWLTPVGESLAGWMLDTQVPAATIPAIILVTYRTANELLFVLWRVLGPRPGLATTKERYAGA